MSGRPRRAAAAVKSYAIPTLAELDSDLDSDTNNDDPPKASTSTSPAKPKGKGKAASKGKGKGKGKGRANRSSSESGSDFGKELAKQGGEPSEESDDIPDDVDDDDDDEDDGPAVIESDDSDIIVDRKKPARKSYTPTASSATSLPLNARKRPAKATPAAIRNSIQLSQITDSTFTRVAAPPPAYEAAVSAETNAFGPLFEPPVRRVDRATGAVVEGEPLTEYQRSVGMQEGADEPFYLRKERMVDLGWRKGKWKMDQNKMADMWGGWYQSRQAPLQVIEPE